MEINEKRAELAALVIWILIAIVTILAETALG